MRISISVHVTGSLITKVFTVTNSSIGNSDAENSINGLLLSTDGKIGNSRTMTENIATCPSLSVADDINGGIIMIIESLITYDAPLNRNYEHEEE